MQQYIIYLYTFLTIFGFWLALQISKRWKSMIFNTFILTVLILVVILVIGKILMMIICQEMRLLITYLV